MRGVVYEALKDHCDRLGLSVAGELDRLAVDFLASQGIEVPPLLPAEHAERDPACRVAKPKRPRAKRSDMPILQQETCGVLRPTPKLARALAAFNEERGYIRAEPLRVDDGAVPPAYLEFQ